MQQFDQYVKLNKKIPPEILTSISSIDDPGRLADTIAAHLPLKLEATSRRCSISFDIKASGWKTCSSQLEREVDILQRRQEASVAASSARWKRTSATSISTSRSRRSRRSSAKAKTAPTSKRLEKKIIAAQACPRRRAKKAEGELKKLKLMSPMSAEATVVRNYIDVLVGLPWSQEDQDQARPRPTPSEVLNEDHYGLDKVRDRILEYLAVQQRVDKVKAPILCLVGPPGRGQDLARPVDRASATGRKYTRMALGGMRDEAEIRGHRRTYIGALPGKVLQKPQQDRHAQPAVLARRDRQAGHRTSAATRRRALLEVLDPEQNHTFGDHYVEVDFDLSDVMFVATSNSMNIPSALLDRMEVIRLAGYTEDEKTQHRAEATCCPSSSGEQRRQGRRTRWSPKSASARHRALLHA